MPPTSASEQPASGFWKVTCSGPDRAAMPYLPCAPHMPAAHGQMVMPTCPAALPPYWHPLMTGTGILRFLLSLLTTDHPDVHVPVPCCAC